MEAKTAFCKHRELNIIYKTGSQRNTTSGFFSYLAEGRKKMKLKKWVTTGLLIITLIAAMVAAGECESDSLFYTKGIISMAVISLNGWIILKHGNI